MITKNKYVKYLHAVISYKSIIQESVWRDKSQKLRTVGNLSKIYTQHTSNTIREYNRHTNLFSHYN